MRARGLHCLGIVMALVASAALHVQPAAAAPVYVAGTGNEFGTLNLTTGTFSPIGTLALPTGDHFMFGMGFGADGNLYGLDANLAGAHLWRINTTTAALTDLGPVGQNVSGATADASGRMYITSDSQTNSLYYQLLPPSTTSIVKGSTGVIAGGLVAVTPDGTELFTSFAPTLTTLPFHLGRIDPASGATTDLGSTGFAPIAGLFVNGTLYGFDSGFAIITINTSTGAGTQVGTYSLPNDDQIVAVASPAASIGIPEPSSVVLGLVATVLVGSVGLVRRRRRA
jgi:hypothetical protein